MSDNVQLSAGSADGAVIATDDIGPGVHYQIIKLAYGALDSATIVTTLAGLPVQLVSPVGAGVEATAIRVTVATDSTGVLSVDDNAGSLTVDNGGTFAVQVNGDALTALQLIDNAISGAGFNITQLAGAAVPIGAGTEAAAIRVTLATDSTGVITVDGTVAVTNAGITTIAGAVAGTEMQCDVLTLPAVTIAAAQTLATVTTVGAVTSITNALPAGDNNIGNVDIVSLPAGNVGQQAMAASLSIVPANNITDATYIGDIKFGEALPAGTAALGKLLAPDIDITTHTNYIKKYYTSAGAATDGIIWSPGAGKRWHVVSMYLQTSAAATITLEDDKSAGDEAIWKGEFAANQGMTVNFGEKYPLASGEDAADLTVTTSAGNIYVTCTGYEI